MRIDNNKVTIIDMASKKIIKNKGEKRMKKPLCRSLSAIIFAAIIACCLIALVGCGESGIEGGRVPIYKGMTLYTDFEIETAKAAAPGAELLSGGFSRYSFATLADGTDNGNHYGQNKQTSDTAKADSSETTGNSATSKEKLESAKSAQGLYYAQQNKDIYITVHIENPDSFEILSFTLNGEKYSSYMFEVGSDMENLVLKLNVGDKQGIVDYTIDAIKYIDGTQIKDVRMDGEQTVTVGIYTEEIQPDVTLSGESVGFNDIAAFIDISDTIGLMDYCDGSVAAVLYSGNEKIYEKELSLDQTNSVEVDRLDDDTEYVLAVEAYYDDLSGDGMATRTLLKVNMKTKAELKFVNDVIYNDGVGFDLEWHEDYTFDKTVTSLTLYKDNKKEREMPVDATEVRGLLSDNEYTLVATYRKGDSDETVVYSFKTLAKSVPAVSLGDLHVGYTEVQFDFNEEDADEVGFISKIEVLYNGNATQIIDSPTERKVAGLLADREYALRVTYAYDLNDGSDVQTVVMEQEFVTMTVTKPSIQISSISSDKTSLRFNVLENDPSSAGEITKIELLNKQNTVVMTTTDKNARSFAELLSGQYYTVKITYSYDMANGQGAKQIVVSKSVETKAKEKPAFSIQDTSRTKTSIAYSITENDRDEIGTLTAVELYKGSEKIKSGALAYSGTFDQLEVGVIYTIRVSYTYNLNDGAGVRSAYSERNIATVPEFSMQSVAIDNETPIAIGEALKVHITADASESVVPVQVTINKKIYPALSGSTNTDIFVNIPYSDYLVGGDHEFAVEEIQVKLIDEILRFAYTSGNKISCTVSGVGLEINNGVITGYGSCTETKLYLGLPVGQAAFKDNTSITEVYISGKSIAYEAFYNCTSLEKIELREGVTSVTSSAFRGCSNVKSLHIPSSLLNINAFIYGDLSNLIIVTVAEDHASFSSYDNIVYNKAKTEFVLIPEGLTGAVRIPGTMKTVFISGQRGINNVTSIILEEGVETISNCYTSKLASVTIPSTVHTISDEAFSNCTSLNEITVSSDNEVFEMIDGMLVDKMNGILKFVVASLDGEVVIPDSVKIIPTYVFRGRNIESVTLHNGVESIESSAFWGCNKLETVILGTGLKSIGSYAFYGCSRIESIVLPDSLQTMGDNAFRECISITYLVIGNGLKEIPAWAFCNCNQLETVIIPDGVEIIDEYAFYNCSSLKSVTIGNGVKTIGSGTFESCWKLEKIEIGKNVETIGSYAFSGTALTRIIIPISVTTIGERAIPNNGSLIIAVEATSKPSGWDKYWNADYNSEAYSTTFWGVERFYTDGYGVTYALTKDKTALVVEYDGSVGDVVLGVEGYTVIGIASNVFGGSSSLISISIPGSVEAIADYAFYNCQKLESVTLANEIKSIGDYAFASCNKLASVTFGSGLNTIGAYAFNNAQRLTSVIIPDSVESIGEGAFQSCDSLESVVIGNGVKTIGAYAFRWCHCLTDLTLGDNVESIGDYAFNSIGVRRVIIPESVKTLGEGAITPNTSCIVCVKAATRPSGWDRNWCSDEWGNTNCTVIWNAKGTYTDEYGVTYALLNDNTAVVIRFEGDAEYIELGVDGYTVTTILSRAFSVAMDNTSVIIPSTVQTIEPYAFCTSFNIYAAAASKPSGWADLWNSDGDVSYYVLWNFKDFYTDSYGVTYTLFNDNTAVISGFDGNAESIVLGIEGYTVVDINNGVFTGNKNLISVSILGSVKVIGNHAFSGCDNLESVTFSEGVKTIGAYAFNDCDKLTSITVPKSLEIIGEYAFYNCRKLVSVALGNGLKSIGDRAFAACYKLASVTFGSSLKTIEAYAFNDCDRLVSVIIPDSVESIGEGAFQSCDSLESVVIGNGVKTIGAYAFRYCYQLSSLDLGNNVESIGDYAFNSIRVSRVIIPESVKTLGEGVITPNTSCIVCVKAATRPSGWDRDWYVDEWGNTNCTVIWNFNEFYTDSQGVRYALINDGTAIVCGCGETSGEIDISLEGYVVTVIASNAFYGCSELTKVTLPNTLEHIGTGAFASCYGLSYVVIPRSVQTIETNAFMDGWVSIYYEGTADEWDAVDGHIGNNYVCFYSATRPSSEYGYWCYLNGNPITWNNI